MRVAFCGLGVMGAPMAGHLASAGHEVTVYNRTSARAEAWQAQHGGRVAPSPAEAAAGAEIVLMCVGADADVRAVGLPALAAMAPGSIFVDHTTASAQVARELDAAARARGIGFLDAPVSGGQAGAITGKLTVMAGGDAATFAAAEPVLRAYSKAVTHMGPAGNGQLTKMVNQICIAGVLQGLAEAMDFATRAGLDTTQVVEAISKGAAQSWQMENRAATMVKGEFDFGFAVDWMRKDLDICLTTAEDVGARLPVTALIDQLYAQVQARGGRRWDTSSLIHLLQKP